MDLTVLILTKNEELHLERLFQNIAPLGARTIVVDSFSTDSTLEICKRYGVEVYYNQFVNQAKQLRWALSTLHIDTSWVMRLDADEILETDLISEIRARLPLLPQDVTAVNLRRRHVFMKRWIKYGGRYPLLLTRIWRPGSVHVEDVWMDEHITANIGRAVIFSSDFSDQNLNDISFFIEKHNRYAVREAFQVVATELGILNIEKGDLKQVSRTTAFKRFVKYAIYRRLPFFVGPTLYFVWRYIFQFGFLDGRQGLIYHFLQGFWYRFLVEVNVVQFREDLAETQGADAQLEKPCSLAVIDPKKI